MLASVLGVCTSITLHIHERRQKFRWRKCRVMLPGRNHRVGFISLLTFWHPVPKAIIVWEAFFVWLPGT